MLSDPGSDSATPVSGKSLTFARIWQIHFQVVNRNIAELWFTLNASYGEPWGVYLSGLSSDPYIYPMAIIRGNHIRHIGGVSSPIKRDGGIVATRCQGMIVEHNVILVESVPILFFASRDAKFFNNQFPTGFAIEAYNADVLKFQNEVTTQGDFAPLLIH